MAATNPGPTLRNPPRRWLRLLMNAAAGAYADWPSLSTAALAITGLAIFFFSKVLFPAKRIVAALPHVFYPQI